MSSIKIDNIDYDLDTLSDDAKVQLQMLQIAEQEVQRLQAQLAMIQTARIAYAKALKEALLSPLEQLIAKGDTIKLT